jgi:hypothetical protein
VAVTLNGLGKYYSQFRTSIAVRETFPNFQDLITLLISEEARVVGTSSNGRSQIAIIVGNLGTWQRTVIKRSMMHKMESCNKGIMHQIAIKAMNNCS